MARERIVITGAGAASAAGLGMEALAAALREARPCVREGRDARFDGATCRLAGFVDDATNDATHDRGTHFALRAAREALVGHMPEPDTAIVLGNSGGGLQTIDEGYHAMLIAGRRRPAPRSVPKAMPSAAVSAIAASEGCSGPAFAVSSACASAHHAVGVGIALLRAGACRRVITGGFDAPLSLGNFRGWEALRALSASGCRPFSADRDGTVLGEGAAIFVLETLTSARERGATIWGELLGHGASSGAAEVTESDARAYALAMRRALADGGVDAGAVDHVHAHGTGTPKNDVAEAAAIAEVCGSVSVSASKGMLGHALGASGALGLAVTLIAMRDGFVPPTIGFRLRDPACAVDVSADVRWQRPALALVNAFAFGDLNASLLVARG